MRTVFLLLAIAVFTAALGDALHAQNYQGSQYCQTCHSGTYNVWNSTLHAKIHLRPDTVAIRPLAAFTRGDSISMGTTYSNARVILRRSGNNDYYARIGVGGQEYRVAYTYGWGYKQRYLVKIDSSYYMLPIQWNLAGYLNNATGSWATYNPQYWFATSGTPQPINNSFRTRSWDKNCTGCHVTGGKVDRVIVGNDTSWKATWANNSSDINVVVGCESCHGPSTGGAGQSHQMNPRKLLSKQSKMEVCAQCHNRATSVTSNLAAPGTHEFPKNEVNNTYFNPTDTTKRLSQFLNTTLAPNGAGGRGTWVDVTAPRQHHQQYHDMIGSAHYTNSFVEVTCFTCHSAHKATPNDKNIVDSLTVGTDRFKVSDKDNTLCLACHAGFGPFARVQKPWVQNPTTFRDSIGRYVNQHTRHRVYDPTNLSNSGGDGRCTKCHMTLTATTARAFDIAIHNWGVISPNQTRRFSTVGTPSLGMINTCAMSCHRNAAGIIPAFGVGTDANISDWREATDLALADTLWRYWQQWGFTSVKEIAGVVPDKYELSQNYPNPFNPSTKINVSVSKRSEVRLTVYNLIGQEIVTLMDGQYNAGSYEVTWNGKDGWGQSAASGLYLYRLDVGNFSSTKKMLLVK